MAEKKEGMRSILSLPNLVDAQLTVEKLRVQTEVRITHLAKAGHLDPDTEELHTRILGLEEFIDKRVAERLKAHPAYPWFSRVKGIGGENIAKVIGLIRIKMDPDHPPRDPNNPNWAETISGLWKYAGFAPGEDGKTMKKVKGQKLEYNSQLRSMCWRLGVSLKRAKGKYYELYLKEKERLTERFIRDGYKILPTPTGKWVCVNCGKNWEKKSDIVPCCKSQQIDKKLREEPAGVIWLGHLDMMAIRKMLKIFLANLWLVWREAEGLPTRVPYVTEKLGHTDVISPEAMVDKPARAKK